jgi:hypothetical protein
MLSLIAVAPADVTPTSVTRVLPAANRAARPSGPFQRNQRMRRTSACR